MRKVILALFVLVLLSCKDEPKIKIVPESSGGLNKLTIVLDNEEWRGSIGEVIREKLAGETDGLPQKEPLFDLNQVPNEAFTGFMRKQRIFLKVEKAAEASFEIVTNVYAKPQKGVIVKGPSVSAIEHIILKDSADIVNTFKETEVKEKIRRIKLSLGDDKAIREAFGISLKFPSAYRYAKEEDNFYWLRKDIPKGDMNITIYEVPMESIVNDSAILNTLIHMRDSISGDGITVDAGGRFITEEAYAPYLNEVKIAGRPSFEIKGVWEVKGKYLAGPFVTYVIRDKRKNRYLILEGFTFKPSSNKRDNMFELESILKSVKFLK